LPDGLYFKKGHWYCVKNKNVTDSYDAKYQKKGTAHFCQTFAAMMYIGSTGDLEPDQFASNIKVAVTFWIAFFNRNKEIAKWFVEKQIKKSGYIKEILAGTNITIGEMTVKDLINFLGEIAASPQSFVGCKEG